MIEKLIKNSEQPVKQITMPLPHMLIRLARANTTWFIAGRGGFKTTMGIAFYNIDCVYELPRSTGIICGPSYEHLGDNTLNPLFNALNEYGFEEGVHYIVGKQPPDYFEKPYIRVDSVKKYDHMISWHNGTNQFLISMAKKGSANGISAQWGVFDEVKLMDEKYLADVVFPVFRGNEKYFSDSPLFMSKFFATDKLADPGKIEWILNKKELNDDRKTNLVVQLQLHLNELKLEYDTSGRDKRRKLSHTIHAVEVRLAKLRQNLSIYMEANHTHVMQVMGDRWYKDKAKALKDNPYELKVAIRNEDPTRPEDGFYPDFDNNHHVHFNDNDYNPNLPLIISSDYQHSVSPIPVAQLNQLDGRPHLSYINSIYTKAPETLEAAVQKFCDYYFHHSKKTVYYCYDQTATGKRQSALEYYKIVVNTLRKNKWQVIKVYSGAAPQHYDKFMDTQNWFKAHQISLHGKRCAPLIKSISGAGAKIVNGKTEKNKDLENTTKHPGVDQATTTHFSDAFDMINDAVLKKNLIKPLAIMGGKVDVR